jgi:hypothetical protein
MNFSTRPTRAVTAMAVALGLIVATGALVRADNLIVDGDAITPVIDESAAFGAVPCGVPTTRSLLLAVTRAGGGAGINVYAGSSTVTFSVPAPPPGISVSIPADTVVLPSNWPTLGNGASSTTVAAAITITPTVAGAGSASVIFSGAGTNVPGDDLNRTDTVSVTWDAGVCATPTSTAVTCPPSVTYTGSSLTPCTATVTGSGGFSQSVPVTHSNNVNAGVATATATFEGSGSHRPSTGSANFTIEKAPSMVSLSCVSPVTYTGAALTPCTATATGAGGLNVALTAAYTDNTDAGNASVAAAYPGDANHTGSNGAGSFTIDRASSTVIVECPGSVVYDGGPQEPCTAAATGAGGLNTNLAVSYVDNVIVGLASANASFAGDANHSASTGSAQFEIGKAESAISIDCPETVPYTGSALEPCAAIVTGVGGLDEPLPIVYLANVNAGTATASASYEGDDNHEPANASSTFEITKASSTVTVTCPTNVGFDGTPKTPCSARVTGAGGLDAPVPVTYSNNTPAGTATATAEYSGDANHELDSDSVTFSIDKAPSLVTVVCLDAVYTGAAQTPCTATVTGADGLNASLPIWYSDNINAGSATATASYPGDANHDPASGEDTFIIDKATSTVSVDCPASVVYNGAAQEECTANVTGAGGLDETLLVTYSNNTNAGTATANAQYPGDANHYGDDHSENFTIERAPSVVSLTCPTVPTIFTGEPLEPCTATVTGVGGLNTEAPVTYTNNVDAGTASAFASYLGDSNHLPHSDATTFVVGQATSAVTVTCPPSVVFNGTTQEPCSANVTGAGGLDAPLAVTYANNLNAGTATASANYGGDANHTASSANSTFEVLRAPSVVNVVCPSSVVYTGSPHQVCSAEVTGVAGLSETLIVSYANNTDAGQATAVASYGGSANHEPDDGSSSFTIEKAPSLVTVTCAPTSLVYTGSALTPCSASVTGAGGLNGALAVTYTANVDAGTATASASYPGAANHEASSSDATFEIAKASSSVLLSCPANVTYTGNEQEPCTANVTGAGGLNAPVPVVYTDNIDAGTANAWAEFTGDTNHEGSADNQTFLINKAQSTVTVVCSDVTYSGSELTPCSATATGAGGLDSPLDITYTNNTDAGTASAAAAFAGDANHDGSSGSASFEIAKAPSVVTVNCSSATFTGAELTPCSATVSGAGGLDESVSVSYADNVNAGTATATASYAGDRNHEPSEGATTFIIAKAVSSVTVTCSPASLVFTGTPLTPCSAVVSGAGGLDASLPVTYSGNVDVGTATASASYAGDANHHGSNSSATFQIIAWTIRGFYKPVDMSTSSTTVWNTVKNGSTVPLKFEVFAGADELTNVADIKSFTQAKVDCSDVASIESPVEVTSTGGTTLRYDSTAGQFIQNWQTPKLAGTCWKVTMTTDDDSSITAWFKLR